MPCLAQIAAMAQVSGSVHDPSGAAVAGAVVKLTQVDIKLERQVTTDDQGRYFVPALPVGPYQLEVTAGGFKTYLQSGIILQVGNQVDINVAMQLGTSSEHVDVQAQASMVETTENTVSQVIEQRRIVELPLNGREATQLILLSAGASTSPAGDMISVGKSLHDSVAISVAGGQGNAVNYLLDGGDNNDALTNVNLPIPFPDALQEFSVETSSLPARFGLHPAAVVNAITKSGTNDWHGDLFEFLRNGDVNARNFFAPVHDSLKRNQFGGTFGDRIIRDKLFVFGGFEGTQNRQAPPQSVAFVPTPAVLNGNFSVIDGPGCVSGGQGKTLIDPDTGKPFPNDQIPVSRFNPQSLKLLTYIPVSQNPCGKFTFGIPLTGDEDQGIIRIDWLKSSKHTIYGRYFIMEYRNPDVWDGTDVLTTAQVGTLEGSNSVTLGDTYTFSPTVVNQFHATYDYRSVNAGPPPNMITPQTLGINIPSTPGAGIYAGVTGYFNVSCTSCVPNYLDVATVDIDDAVDVVRGKHQMAFGGNFVRHSQDSNITPRLNGQFTFNGQYAAGKSVGDALAAFMLGVPSDFTQAGAPTHNDTRETVVALWAQDSIRLTSHLTVNLGLRWDPAMAPYDTRNVGDNFSQAAFNAGQKSTVYTNAPAGLLFYGDPGVPRGFQNDDLHQFSPRIGIAWDPTGSGRQTIRVSGAILRDAPDMWNNQKLTSGAPYSTQLDVPYPFQEGGNFSNPWAGYPGGDPFPLPSPVPSNYVFPVAGSYVSLPQKLQEPYTSQWGLSYQRQISANWLASVSYIGNKTTHIWTSTDADHAVYIPGSSASTNLRRLLYLQNPALGAGYGLIEESVPGGNSNYNGLLLTLQHRFGHGFTLLSNYTWSHCLSDVDHLRELQAPEYENPYDRRADYGNCDFDIRHQMNTSLVMVSPVSDNRILGRLFGQWQIAPIVSMHTGLPINITDGSDVSETAINLDRPNLVLPDAYSSAGGTSYLNRAAFQVEATGTFGNLGRDALFGPGMIEFDMALSRTFRIRERWQLTPRFEAFNVINHTNFLIEPDINRNPSPTTILSSSQFGIITTAADPRILQFALKLQF